MGVILDVDEPLSADAPVEVQSDRGAATLYAGSSVKSPSVPEIRRGGWALVALDACREMAAAVCGPLRANPQTAARATYWAVEMASTRASTSITTMRDCKTVVDATALLPERRVL